MFERFTDRSRRVVVLAQEEARMLSHNYIGTEHILLGLLHEREGIAGKALDSLGVTLESARAAVEAIVGRGEHAPMGHIPFTPRAKKTFDSTLREALQLGVAYIGTEHILLGLLKTDGAGVQVLNQTASSDDVRSAVLTLLRGGLLPKQDRRTELVALFSDHVPTLYWSADRQTAVIACSCGADGRYTEHLPDLILGRLK